MLKLKIKMTRKRAYGSKRITSSDPEVGPIDSW